MQQNKVNLQDVINELPKSVDLIKQSKQDMINQLKNLNNLEKKIKESGNKINEIIKAIDDVKLMDKNMIKKSNEYLSLNAKYVNLQFDTLIKIEKIKDFLNELKIEKKYPSEWMGGKVPGEIVETEDGCRAIYDCQSRSFKYKNIINSPKMFGCADKQDCIVQAKKYLYEYFDKLNKVINKYRYINSNTIEVQLSQDKTFLTDSKNIELINNYRIGLKHDKRYDKYYITYVESPKVNKLFTELAFGISRARVSNGCDLDLREINVIDMDNSKLIKQNDNKLYDKINSNNQIEKQKFNSDGLEMYKWFGGKYAGTVFQRAGQLKWSVVVKKQDGSVVTKTLSFTNETKDKVYAEAIKIRNGLSDTFGLTTNKIRIIDNKMIEVKLTKEQIMITDYKFLNVVEKYPLYASKSEGENSKYYTSMMIGNIQKQFHNFITGWKMVDHIDRNPMNNCLSNLRETTYKENNNNRTKSNSSNAIELGVTYSAKDNAYKARIKQDDKEYCKQFSIKKYGKDEALRLAIETRRDFNRAFNCMNG